MKKIDLISAQNTWKRLCGNTHSHPDTQHKIPVTVCRISPYSMDSISSGHAGRQSLTAIGGLPPHSAQAKDMEVRQTSMSCIQQLAGRSSLAPPAISHKALWL